MKQQVTVELSKFQGELAHMQAGPITLKLSQNIVTSMAFIIDQSCGDFQQGGYLYKPTVAFIGHIGTCERPTGLRNKPQQKQTCQHLAVV